MNRFFAYAALGVGLAAIAWIASGYLRTNLLALAMTGTIGAFYIAGAVELQRFQQATSSLRSALAGLPDRLLVLGDWIVTLNPSLRSAVRLRIEGERIGLPGPALVPYLVGLLVLLGMLGTFIGMVVTLDGAVMALESTTDLAAIRSALAAPVKGLGLAFGTSVAGVAASAMLGLASALLRRERLAASQALDARIATSLRPHSLAHQRERTLEALHAQSQALPALVERIDALAQAMQQRDEALAGRLLAAQDGFHQHAGTAYTELASSVDRTLRQSVSDSARLTAEVIRPIVETTMTGLANEGAAIQRQLGAAVQQQLDGLATRFDATVATVAGTWTQALDRHERSSDALAARLHDTLAAAQADFARGSDALLASVDARQSAAHADARAQLTDAVQRSLELHGRIADTAALQLEAVTTRFGSTAESISQHWGQALADQQRHADTSAAALQRLLDGVVDDLAQRSSTLLAALERTQAALQTELAARDEQRLAAWTGSLDSVARTLDERWQRAGERGIAQQRAICDTLEQTARAIHEQAQAQASATIGEVSRLVDAAAQAPRAAAEAVDLLRQKLSESVARDNEHLAERSRIMAALDTLLGAVDRAATGQREAIDALVASASTVLEQAGSQFRSQVEAESARIADAATQVAGSTVDVSSVGEAFATAVQLFADTSRATLDQLQRIEAALDRHGARSDEQLAYYVAQAREIVELSVSSQGRIVEDLQQLAARQASVAAEAA